MRKNYFFTLFCFLLISSFGFSQSVIITAIIDGKAPSDGCNGSSGSSNPKAVELYVDGTVDFTGYTYEVESNGSSGGASWNSEDISGLGVRTDEFVYISPGSTQTLFDMYSGATSANTHDGGSSFNGNDAVRITDGTNVIDQFGDPADVTGSSDHDNPWAFQDSYATRKDGTTANGGTFNVADFNIFGDNYFDNNSITSCADMLAAVQFGTFSTSTSSDPALSFVSPSAGATFSPSTNSINVSFNIQNFTLSGNNGSDMTDGSGDGYIIGTATVNTVLDGSINIFETSLTYDDLDPGDTVTLDAELVDNSGNSLSPAVTASVTFSVEDYTQVGDIATLRAGTQGNYYELTGEAILTFIGTSRNQKYIQDGTAAILIDDNDGTITTSYNVGDGISGIRGRLGSFSGVMQFVPEEDPGAASSNGNAVTSQTVTIAQLNSNLDDYESEFITINDVDFVDADGSATFSTGSNYDITDGTNTMEFRVHFTGTDIDGTLIPYSSANITGIAGEFAGNSQIFGIDLANIVLGVQTNEIAGYSAYPNPVKGNGLTITTSSADKKTVAIYNVLGRRVFTQSFTGTRETLNVSNISSGIYILKVTEGNKISTQKLIIE